jgi:sulfate/thiosulfate transport system ATP-binding protein
MHSDESRSRAPRRPHDLVVLRVSEGAPSPGAQPGTVTRVTHLGFEVKVELELAAGGDCWVQLSRGTAADLGLQAGQQVWVARADAVSAPSPVPILSA